MTTIKFAVIPPSITVPAFKIVTDRKNEYNKSWLAADKANSRKWLAQVALRADAAPQLALITGKKGGLTKQMVAHNFAKALLSADTKEEDIVSRGESLNQIWSQVNEAENFLGKTEKVQIKVTTTALVFATASEVYTFAKRERLEDFNAINKAVAKNKPTDLVLPGATVPRSIVKQQDGSFTTKRGTRVPVKPATPVQAPVTPEAAPVKSFDESKREALIKSSPEFVTSLKDVKGGFRVLDSREREAVRSTLNAALLALIGQPDVLQDDKVTSALTKANVTILKKVVQPMQAAAKTAADEKAAL